MPVNQQIQVSESIMNEQDIKAGLKTLEDWTNKQSKTTKELLNWVAEQEELNKKQSDEIIKACDELDAALDRIINDL